MPARPAADDQPQPAPVIPPGLQDARRVPRSGGGPRGACPGCGKTACTCK